jgi:hypothetical protein
MSNRVLSRRLTMLALAFTSFPLLAAEVTGSFHHGKGKDAMKVELNARSTDNSGGATGQLKFQATVELPDVDEDDPFGQKGPADLSMKVDIDCLVAKEGRASMSGIVRDASVIGYAGRRVLFAVEDGGEGANAGSDKFTWGVYGVQHVKWSPADSELAFDDGWGRSWKATDSERADDAGVVINRGQDGTDCRAFALSAYDLTPLAADTGNIQINR